MAKPLLLEARLCDTGKSDFFFYIGVVKLRLDFDAMSDDVYFNQI